MALNSLRDAVRRISRTDTNRGYAHRRRRARFRSSSDGKSEVARRMVEPYFATLTINDL